MKIKTLIKKNKMMVFVVIAYLALLVISPESVLQSLNNSVYYLLEMLQVIPIIFVMTVAIEAWVPKELIIKGLGDDSGFKGNLMAVLLGSISAGPIYAAFPIGKSLMKKGAGIKNVVIIISAWAVIKVPMLANEAKFLGIDFMIVRWILTVIAILIMGYLTAGIVKKSNIPGLDKTAVDVPTINEDYCIGCGICAKMMPQIYKMKEKKAIVTIASVLKEQESDVKETVKKCPANAISFK